MDIRGLGYFARIAELGSFNRAADYLRITQPALSRQVQKLEGEFGTKLFLRHGHGVTLTPAGEKLRDRASFVLHELHQLRLEMLAAADVPVGQVAIATSPAVGSQLLPLLIERYSQVAPQVRIRAIQGLSNATHELLSRGGIDVAVMPSSVQVEREFITTPLMRHRVVIVGSKDSALAEKIAVPFRSLAGMPLILPGRMNSLRAVVDAKALELVVTLKIKVEVDGLSSSRSLVRRGVGYWITHLDSVYDEVTAGLMVAPLIVRPTIDRLSVIATQRHRPLSAASRLMIALIQEVAAELIAGGIWGATE